MKQNIHGHKEERIKCGRNTNRKKYEKRNNNNTIGT